MNFIKVFNDLLIKSNTYLSMVFPDYTCKLPIDVAVLCFVIIYYIICYKYHGFG